MHHFKMICILMMNTRKLPHRTLNE
jgi:hypothetical protein